jgi:hypothetical protein
MVVALFRGTLSQGLYISVGLGFLIYCTKVRRCKLNGYGCKKQILTNHGLVWNFLFSSMSRASFLPQLLPWLAMGVILYFGQIGGWMGLVSRILPMLLWLMLENGPFLPGRWPMLLRIGSGSATL